MTPPEYEQLVEAAWDERQENASWRCRCPKETEQLAASLAAGYSKARKGGRVAVHLCRCEDVSKPRGFPPGKVLLDRFKSVQATPWRPDSPDS